MRYPVGDGSKETFLRDWYSAQRFGAFSVASGYHEAEDLNLRTGGNTDLGYPVYAIAAGRVDYSHYDQHPNTGFGRHLMYRIEGPWGTRWVHLAHLAAEDFGGGGSILNEGTLVGRIGKSGTTLAHLHFAILKVNPTNIDNVANSRVELDANWEDPLEFIDRWMAVQPEPTAVITDQTRIPQIGNKTVAEIKVELDDLSAKIEIVRRVVSGTGTGD